MWTLSIRNSGLFYICKVFWVYNLHVNSAPLFVFCICDFSYVHVFSLLIFPTNKPLSVWFFLLLRLSYFCIVFLHFFDASYYSLHFFLFFLPIFVFKFLFLIQAGSSYYKCWKLFNSLGAFLSFVSWVSLGK